LIGRLPEIHTARQWLCQSIEGTAARQPRGDDFRINRNHRQPGVGCGMSVTGG
jgi:hypothetical protein